MPKIQYRQDTSANWTSQNPILDNGEPGFDVVLKKWKLGDGVTPWNSLAFKEDTGGGGGTWGSITGTLSNQTDLNSALNGKQATITGAATTITSANLTSSRLMVTDGSGKVAVSTVTTTNLTDLTDSGDSALHYHVADRNRANHTGTQISSTISDLVETIQDTVASTIQNGTGISWVYNDTVGTLTPTVTGGGGGSAYPPVRIFADLAQMQSFPNVGMNGVPCFVLSNNTKYVNNGLSFIEVASNTEIWGHVAIGVVATATVFANANVPKGVVYIDETTPYILRNQPALLRSSYETWAETDVGSPASASNYFVDATLGRFQVLTNTAAFTLRPPADEGSYDIYMRVVNGTGAGVITIHSTWNGATTGSFNTTAGNQFLCRIVKNGARVRLNIETF